MTKKFIDGSDAETPYVAVIGPDTYISDYATWRALEQERTSLGGEILGHAGKVWYLRDRKKAIKLARRLGATSDVVTHAELAAFPPLDALVCQVSDFTIVTILGALSSQTIKMIEFLGLEAIQTDDGTVIEWPVSDGSALDRLARLPTPSLTLLLRRRGWMISAELRGNGTSSDLVARLIAERSNLPNSLTAAELPQVLNRALDLSATVDADFDTADPAAIDSLTVSDAPGWHKPTAAGRKYFDFQRAGIEFVASRGGRALISDDMGLGKTAQALGFAASSGGERVVVVAPAALRCVWRREIVAWDVATEDQIHVIEPGSSAELIPATARVVLTTYDLIAGRALIWREPDQVAFMTLSRWLAPYATGDDPAVSLDRKKLAITLRRPIAGADRAPIAPERLPKWRDLLRKLANPRLSALESWAPDLTIFDEAHHAKTPTTKRSAASVQLSESSRYVLCLTGTPIQNRPEEGAQLVHLVNPRQYRVLRDERVSIERCKEMLGPISIRRLKENVLADLPPLTEQLIELPGPMVVPDLFSDKRTWNPPLKDVPEWARDLSPGVADFARWIAPNLNSVSSMRAALGKAKARREDILELLADMVSTGPLIIFAAHHDSIDTLTSRLLAKSQGRIVSVDGRTPVHRRAEIVDEFQAGRLDCLVAGVDALGEGITLTRANRVVFLETTWKPTTYQQARDRVRRIGQPSSVHAIYLLAPHALDYCLHALATHKAGVVSAVQDEAISVMGAQITGGVEDGRLKVQAERSTALPVVELVAYADRNECASGRPFESADSSSDAAFAAQGASDAPIPPATKRSSGAARMRAYRQRHGAAARERHRAYMREWRRIGR